MSEDQLQPSDTLDDRGVDDVLDEGYSPPEKLRGADAKDVTAAGELEGETIDERLAQEEPEEPAYVEDDRVGRLFNADGGYTSDTEDDLVAGDAGIDGGAASAEEAAMHWVPTDEEETHIMEETPEDGDF